MRSSLLLISRQRRSFLHPRNNNLRAAAGDSNVMRARTEAEMKSGEHAARARANKTENEVELEMKPLEVRATPVKERKAD